MKGLKPVDVLEKLALHEQVAAEIRRAIAEGEAKPGERLPPARDLAAVLGVISKTSSRAARPPGQGRRSRGRWRCERNVTRRQRGIRMSATTAHEGSSRGRRLDRGPLSPRRYAAGASGDW